jgi:hypothetical protein
MIALLEPINFYDHCPLLAVDLLLGSDGKDLGDGAFSFQTEDL